MDEVLNILYSRLSDTCAQQWCLDLVNGDVDCKRLALCLAIELRKPHEEVVLMEHLDNIFAGCTYDHDEFVADSTGAHPRIWFARRLKALKETVCGSNASIIPTTDPIVASANQNNYVSVMDFYILRNHYYRRAGGYSDANDNNPDFIETFIKQHPDFLDEVGRLDLSQRPIWVTTTNELERIKSENIEYDDATSIMNSLGLQPRYFAKDELPDTWNMYFRIEYPCPCGITAFQPSSLNKDWQNAQRDLYLSYIKKDSFGLTYASDASGKSAKEQIHEPITDAKGFRVFYIGKHSDLKPDKSAILTEGEKRLHL